MIEDTPSSPWLWFLSRGTGIVALMLLTVGVVLGIISKVGWRFRWWPRFASQALHRYVNLLALLLLVVHVVTVEVHAGQHVAWIDAVLPFGSRFRPVWTAAGALASNLMIALVITSYLRRFIGHRVWRTLHWSAYAAWLLAVAHGLGTGTDARKGWSIAINLACVGTVVLAVLMRIASGWRRGIPVRLAALAVTVVTITQLGMWAGDGPLAPNWPHRAGTPTPAPTATARPVPVPPAQ